MGTGKKVAWIGCLGCGGIILLVFLLLAGGVGFLSYQGYQFGKEIGTAYQGVAVGYKDVNFDYPFSLPADGVLDASRTETALQARSKLAAFARSRLDALEQTGEEIGSKMDSPGFLSKIQGARKIASIITLAAHLGADIGQEHVRLLQEASMSSYEYQWIIKSYLGTLYKASQQNEAASAAVWKEYFDQFESAHGRVQGVDMNFGRKHIRGDDLDGKRLLQFLEDVPLQESNKEIVLKTKELLFPDKEAGILDILALQLEDIFEVDPPVENSNDPIQSATAEQ